MQPQLIFSYHLKNRIKESKEVALFKDLLIYNTSFNVDHIAFLVFTFIHTELNFIALTLIDKTQTKGHSMEGIKRFLTISENEAYQYSQYDTHFFFLLNFTIQCPHWSSYIFPGASHSLRYTRTQTHPH